jgi:hypothetical protein
MTKYAYATQSTSIEILPGEIKTYRLSVMMPGYFQVRATRLEQLPLGPPKQPSFESGPLGQPTPPPMFAAPFSQPGDLVMDLFHGEQLVNSSGGLAIQTTLSMGDNTWWVRFQLADGSLETETYLYSVEVMFPSLLPILTRRIPMSFSTKASKITGMAEISFTRAWTTTS